jgi:hypothetical protein
MAAEESMLGISMEKCGVIAILSAIKKFGAQHPCGPIIGRQMTSPTIGEHANRAQRQVTRPTGFIAALKFLM